MIFPTKSSLNSMNHNQILKWYDALDNQTLVIDTFLDKAVKKKFALTVLPLDRYNAQPECMVSIYTKVHQTCLESFNLDS